MIGHGRIAGRARREKSVDELSLGGVILASVQPDVETSWLRGIVVFRQRDAVRQQGAVDFGTVGEDLLLALIPLRLVALELSGALDTLVQDRESMLDSSLIPEHVRELAKHTSSLDINLDIT